MKRFIIVLVCLSVTLCALYAYAGPALTDEQKLEASKQAFIEKLDTIDDWEQFKTLVKNISPTMVKNFLKNKLEDREQDFNDASEELATKAIDYGDLADEIDAIE